MLLTINRQEREVADAPDRPLLWVIRDELGLTGTRFGCGLGQCGACTVLLGDQAIRACQTPLSTVGQQPVTTIEGLAGAVSQGAAGEEQGPAISTTSPLHPLQQAFLDEQVPQCGYCQSGQIMRAAALLRQTPQPTDEQIVAAMQGNLCRCGTYVRIKRAIRRAADGKAGA